MLVVDNRWAGQNGIGRYAKEVLSRLTVPWEPIEPSGSPSSPQDFLLKNLRVNGTRPTAIYSPGYNGFLRNIPQTITVLDLIHLESPGSVKYRPYYDLFLKPLLRKNRHVITISDTSKKQIERWIGDPRVDVINAGMGSAAEFALEGKRISAERPYFLYVGNLRTHKNVSTIVEAMKYLADSDLYIVSSDQSGVAALSEKYDVADRVKIFSGVGDEELASLYRGARATLQPSLLEGFGLPAQESALCGTPVIFWDGCESVKEICAGGGLPVMNAKDAREWASVMAEVREGQSFPSGVVYPARYSWADVGREVSAAVAQHS